MGEFRKAGSFFERKRVQTDNRSEFEKCFREYVEREGVSQYYILSPSSTK